MHRSSWGQGASSQRALFRQVSYWELPGVLRMEKEEDWVATCLSHRLLISEPPLQHPEGDISSLPDKRKGYMQPLRNCGKCSWPGDSRNLMPVGRLCQNLYSPVNEGWEQQGPSKRQNLECVAEVAGPGKCISPLLKIGWNQLSFWRQSNV